MPSPSSPLLVFRELHGFAESKQQAMPASNKPSSFVALNSDIQMRIVGDLEDHYWHTHFSRVPYYVQGRGYDQYQPAYRLGWQRSLEHPDASFQDFVQALESDWNTHRGSSLLPWREVEVAVKDAWEHANVQMQKMQSSMPVQFHGKDIPSMLYPLYRGCGRLLDDMQRMHQVPMHDFAAQVLGRHIQMLSDFMSELTPYIDADMRRTPSVALWGRKLHLKWFKLQADFSEWAFTDVFDLCELRERNLLALYLRTKRKKLPVEIKEILARHAKQLSMNLDKLVWVRHNWMV